MLKYTLGRLALLLPLTSVLVYAHFTWMTPSVSPLEVGQTVQVRIGHGHKFPASEEAIITAGAEVYAMAPSGRRTLLAPKPEKPLLVAGYKVAEAGMHRFVLAQDRGVRSWTTQGVQPGGKDKHPQARRSARVFRSAVSYALTPGAVYEKAKPLGLVFELMGEVTADLFKRIGMNLDYQAIDWTTVVQRRIKMDPAEQGGWNVFCIYDSGFNQLDPASHALLRGNGKQAQFGWPSSPRIEELRDAWFQAATLEEQKVIARRIQMQAFEDVPYIPLGQSVPPTAYRRNLTGVLNGQPFFWNVRKTQA